MLAILSMLAQAPSSDVVTVADALARLRTEAAKAETPYPGGPATSPRAWVTGADYPVDAMRGRQEGVTQYLLTFDPAGQVTACEVTVSSGYAELDETACRLLVERARFIPDRDAAGKAVGGTYSGRIAWRIPPAPAP